MDDEAGYRERWERRRTPQAPGDMCRLFDVPGFEKGVRGYRNGPKMEKDQADDGFLFELKDMGMVISVWSAPPGTPCFAATTWFYVWVPGKGLSWFPYGHLLTADSPPYERPPRTHNVSRWGFSD